MDTSRGISMLLIKNSKVCTKKMYEPAFPYQRDNMKEGIWSKLHMFDGTIPYDTYYMCFLNMEVLKSVVR